MSDYEQIPSQSSTPPRAPHIERALRFTARQWVGIPLLMAIPVLALCGVFGNHAGIVGRVVIVYAFVWMCFRVIGKRELTGMSPLEIATLLLIPQLFSRAITGQDYSMINAVIGASTLIVLVFLTSVGTYRNRTFGRLVIPRPTVLVSQGVLVREHLHQERVTPDEVFGAMHRSGIARLEDVEWAVLQADGHIAVIPRDGVRVIPVVPPSP
jgi:uncharacterized membrane protein YcaP (DUF421 family)